MLPTTSHLLGEPETTIDIVNLPGLLFWQGQEWDFRRNLVSFKNGKNKTNMYFFLVLGNEQCQGFIQTHNYFSKETNMPWFCFKNISKNPLGETSVSLFYPTRCFRRCHGMGQQGSHPIRQRGSYFFAGKGQNRSKRRSGQITIIPKPELRRFWGDSLTKPQFKVTSAEVVIICPGRSGSTWWFQPIWKIRRPESAWHGNIWNAGSKRCRVILIQTQNPKSKRRRLGPPKKERRLNWSKIQNPRSKMQNPNSMPHKHCHKQCEYHGVISWGRVFVGQENWPFPAPQKLSYKYPPTTFTHTPSMSLSCARQHRRICEA